MTETQLATKQDIEEIKNMLKQMNKIDYASPLLDGSQAARYLNISLAKLHIIKHKIKRTLVGQTPFYHIDDLNAYIGANRS